MDGKEQWIAVKLSEKQKLKEIHIKFDTDLTTEIEPTLSGPIRRKQRPGLPYSLVKRYSVEAWKDGKKVWEDTVDNNCQRFCIHRPNIEADTIRIVIQDTWGCDNAKIFEIRAYA